MWAMGLMDMGRDGRVGGRELDRGGEGIETGLSAGWVREEEWGWDDGGVEEVDIVRDCRARRRELICIARLGEVELLQLVEEVELGCDGGMGGVDLCASGKIGCMGLERPRLRWGDLRFRREMRCGCSTGAEGSGVGEDESAIVSSLSSPIVSRFS